MQYEPAMQLMPPLLVEPAGQYEPAEQLHVEQVVAWLLDENVPAEHTVHVDSVDR